MKAFKHNRSLRFPRLRFALAYAYAPGQTPLYFGHEFGRLWSFALHLGNARFEVYGIKS